MSADDAYYRSKTPLILSGTLEARAKLHPSYEHVGGAVVTSSSKYYASVSPVQAGAQELVLELKLVQLIADADVVSNVISAVGAGATEITVTGDALEVDQARLAVDLSVGRNVLTRVQADGVVFVVRAAPSILEVEEVVAPELPVTPVTVEEPQESGKKGRKRGKRTEVAESVDSKDITEADVSAVFGEDDSDS